MTFEEFAATRLPGVLAFAAVLTGLVVEGKLPGKGKVARGSLPRWDFGVLSDGTFTPVPGSASLPIMPFLAF